MARRLFSMEMIPGIFERMNESLVCRGVKGERSPSGIYAVMKARQQRTSNTDGRQILLILPFSSAPLFHSTVSYSSLSSVQPRLTLALFPGHTLTRLWEPDPPTPGAVTAWSAVFATLLHVISQTHGLTCNFSIWNKIRGAS